MTTVVDASFWSRAHERGERLRAQLLPKRFPSRIVETATNQPTQERHTMKSVVTGRPIHVTVQQGHVLLRFRPKPPPALPRGLTPPPAPTVDHVVLVGTRQWAQVEGAVAADPTVLLIVDGYACVSAETGGLALFGINVRTVMNQRAARVAPPSVSSTSISTPAPEVA